MSLIKWNDDKFPMLPGLFDNFFHTDISDFLGDWKGTVPSVNVREDNDTYSIDLAAPGMSKENFDVKVENGTLIITGKKNEEIEGKNDKYHRKEFHYHSFQRSFYLPEIINTESIKANYKDGILSVSLPKKEEVKMENHIKQISIT